MWPYMPPGSTSRARSRHWLSMVRSSPGWTVSVTTVPFERCHAAGRSRVRVCDNLGQMPHFVNTNDDHHEALPQYSDLPVADGGARSGWHVFGPGDQLGRIALQTPDRVRSAAGL